MSVNQSDAEVSSSSGEDSHHDLPPLCWMINDVAQENPSLTQKDTSDDLLFFPVPGLKFNDLYDWSNKEHKKTQILPFHGLQRSTSTAGSEVEVNEERITLFKYKDKVYAILERCPHAGGPLHLGDIEVLPEKNSLCVICPWHSWKFDLNTGHVISPPKREDKRTTAFKTHITESGDILIGFDNFNRKYFNMTDTQF